MKTLKPSLSLILTTLCIVALSQNACSSSESAGEAQNASSPSEDTSEALDAEGPGASDLGPTSSDAGSVPDASPNEEDAGEPDTSGEAAGDATDLGPEDETSPDTSGEGDTTPEGDATPEGDTSETPLSDATELDDSTAEDEPEVSDALSEPEVTEGLDDVGPGDINAPEVTEPEDADAELEAEVDAPPVLEVMPTAAFNAPEPNALIDQGTPLTISALVTAGDTPLEDLTWTLSSDVDGPLTSESVPGDGVVAWTGSTLSPGPHTLTLIIATPTNDNAAQATLNIGICPVMTPDDFDADIEAAGWKLYGDAYWDLGGWLELTGLDAAGGSIYKISETLSAADTTIQFDFYTGNGVNGGADGFAMTVIDVDNVEELENYIETAKNGGCLGYGTAAWCGDMPVEAFHVEIDTFYNQNDPFFEPGPSNHIAVTLNGDPSDHVLLADGLYLEDAQWHTIEIVVVGTNVVVNLDGEMIIEGDIPGLTFRGGYIGFSGSTGWATNWHRVDNLTVVQECTSL